MSDAAARALGAGETIEVNGNEYQIEPISTKPLTEIQRAALRAYKRNYLETFTANADILGDNADQLIEDAALKAAEWDVDDLPSKRAHDTSKVPITEPLKAWLKQKYEDQAEALGKMSDKEIRQVLTAALDRGDIDAERVKKLTEHEPGTMEVPYDMWWVTASREGMLTFVWAAVQASNPDLEKKDVERWPITKIMEAAKKAESVTAPALGNT